MKNLRISLTILILFFLIPTHVRAETIKPYLVTEAFEKNVPGDIKVYFVKNIPLEYKSGKVLLSLNPDGTGESLVGESIDVSISYPGDGNFERINTNLGCTVNKKMPPLDITHLLFKGLNNIQVRYRRTCFPGIKNGDQLYLVHFDDYEPTAEPFLDLPWDYVGKGQSFEDAAIKISAYFDHQYPLISTNLVEPSDYNTTIVKYSGDITNDPYSRHDGYDYAFISNVKFDDPVLAAAPGEATYVNSCSDCGNAIHIDHKNGYQTRYYHLQPDSLIINIPNQKINVTPRQMIGKVGFSGNIDPSGIGGAHLHFMLVKDKNGDGNFDDNIPDGLVDPYGWQSSSSDPWENYVFDYAGKHRQGSKSIYMWTNKLSGLKKTLKQEGGIFSTSRYNITFPKDFIVQDLILSMEPKGIINDSSNIRPLGQGIDITLWDGINTLYNQFQKNFNIKFDFSNIDTSRFNLNTLSMYSSNDGINWNKESTTLDWNKNEATTQVNHLTQFTLMGEKLDSISPITTAVLSGTEITSEDESKVFNSPVIMKFTTSDEPQENSLGIDYTLYKINDEEWNLYENPVRFTEKKPYTISYYSADKDGNIEQTKTIRFSILEDIQPELEVYFNFDIKEFVINPLLNDASITSQNIKKKNKDVTTFTTSSGQKATSIVTQTRVDENKYIFRINSLKYNNESSSIEKDKLSVEYIKNDKKKGDQIKQVFNISDSIKVVLLYSEKENKTQVKIQEVEKEKIKEELDGFKKFVIYTDKGNLDFIIN